MTYVKTPSYIGTHINGFDNFLTEIVTNLPAKTKPNDRLNIIPGWVNPGDIREIKAMLRKMDVSPLFLTDYSDTLDGGLYFPKPRHPGGGTTVEELKDSANSTGTIAIQKHVGGKAAKIMSGRYEMPSEVIPMPIGIENTDVFMQSVSEITGKKIPKELRDERARLLDAIVDAHMFVTGLKVAIFGDPDMVEAMVRFCAEMGLRPCFALTASDSTKWGEDLLATAEELNLDMEILVKSDLHELHKKIKENPVDILIGTSKGKFIAQTEGIPLVRVGFPVEDRFGYQRRAIVGYRGGINLVDEIVNSYLENGKVSSRDVVSNTLLEIEKEENEER